MHATPFDKTINHIKKGVLPMKLPVTVGSAMALAGLCGCATSKLEMGNLAGEVHPESFYLPNADASRLVSVATNGAATNASGGSERNRP